MSDNKVICIDDRGIERLILPAEHRNGIVISSDGVFSAESDDCGDLTTIESKLSPEQMIRIAQKLLEWGYRRMYTKEQEN